MTNQAMLVVGILSALGVGFIIPRKPAEEFCERVIRFAEKEARISAIILFAVFYAVMEGLSSQYSYGVIGLLIGFAINSAIFILWR